MKAARTLRSSDLNLILPTGPPSATSKVTSAVMDSEYNDILGADDSKTAYSADVVEKNVTLQSEVVEIEQLLETTGEVQLEGIRTQRSILSQRNHASLECLRLFDAEYRCPTSSHFNKDKLIELLELEVPVSSLVKNLKTARRIGKLKVELASARPASPVAADAPEPPIAEEPTVSMTPRAQAFDSASAVSSARSMGSGVSCLPAEVGISISRVEEVLAVLHQKLRSNEQQQQLREELMMITQAYFGGHPGGPLGNSIIQLNAMAFTDVMQFIKTKVNSMAAAFEEKQHAAVSAQADYDAVASQSPVDVVAYEKALRGAIDAYEAAMKVNADRLNQLMMNSDSEGNFKSTYEATTDLVRNTVVEQRVLRTELLKDISHDSAKLGQDGERRFMESEAARAAYDEWRAKSLSEIESCSQQQDALWEQVEQLVARIGDIGKTRMQLVKAHQAQTEAEYQRRRHYDEYAATHKAHVAHLSTLKDLSAYTLKMLDHIELFYEHMTTAVEAKNFEEGLAEMKQADQSSFVQLYAQFVDRAAELLSRRNARRLLAARTSRVSESILNSEPHAPDRDHHKVVYSENNALCESIGQECEALAARVERWIPLCENVMEQLEIAAASDTEQSLSLAHRAFCLEDRWFRKVDEICAAVSETMTEEAAALSELQRDIEVQRQTAAEYEANFHEVRSKSPQRKRFVKESRARKNLTGRTPRTPGQ